MTLHQLFLIVYTNKLSFENTNITISVIIGTVIVVLDKKPT